MVSLFQVKVSPGSKLAKSSILFISFLASDISFSLSKEANNAGTSSSSPNSSSPSSSATIGAYLTPSISIILDSSTSGYLFTLSLITSLIFASNCKDKFSFKTPLGKEL